MLFCICTDVKVITAVTIRYENEALVLSCIHDIVSVASIRDGIKDFSLLVLET